MKAHCFTLGLLAFGLIGCGSSSSDSAAADAGMGGSAGAGGTGGQAGASGSGGSAGFGSCGEFSSANPACIDCVKNECCAEAGACYADAACLGYLSCYMKCAGSDPVACRAACASSHGEGEPLGAPLAVCLESMSASCENSCNFSHWPLGCSCSCPERRDRYQFDCGDDASQPGGTCKPSTCGSGYALDLIVTGFDSVPVGTQVSYSLTDLATDFTSVLGASAIALGGTFGVSVPGKLDSGASYGLNYFVDIDGNSMCGGGDVLGRITVGPVSADVNDTVAHQAFAGACAYFP
jgi:hypothetical protein